VGQLFALLYHLGAWRWGNGRLENRGTFAGKIGNIHNDLRRRQLSSLIWDEVEKEESVYYHDSVLTLAESTATLQLAHETDVHLSENTLVTIEPFESESSGAIRLRFRKGGVRARNPFTATELDGEDWQVQLTQGSDIDLRQVGEGAIEFHVHQGSAQVRAADGERAVGASEILRVGPTGTQSLAVSADLQWKSKVPARLYRHSGNVSVHLEWIGPASVLWLQTIGHLETQVDVTGRSEHDLVLGYGQHRLYLRDAESSSVALDVEVRPAPLVHLLRPLPRNRWRVNEPLEFVWSAAQGVSAYELKFEGAGALAPVRVQENSHKLRFDGEEDLQWSVMGVDSEGFEIPPLYSYPLHVRENPLAAPKIKSPQFLRRPASEKQESGGRDRIERDRIGTGAWLWNWLLPAAMAEDGTASRVADAGAEYEAVFSWEPVEGADHYMIEISANSDFREPMLAEKVSAPEFVWKRVVGSRFFWRVAAGTKRGRLGIFSEPVEGVLAGGDGLVVRRRRSLESDAVAPLVAAPAVAAPVVAAPAAPTAPEPEIQTVVEETSTPPRDTWLWLRWRPSYYQWQVDAADNVHVQMSGAGVMAVELGREAPKWRWRGFYQLNQFKPATSSNTPLQSNMTWSDLRFSFSRGWGSFGFGVVARTFMGLQRESVGSVKSETIMTVGPALEFRSAWGTRWSYGASLSAHTGSGVGAIATGHELQVRLLKLWRVGLALEAVALQGSKGTGSILGGASFLGLDF